MFETKILFPEAELKNESSDLCTEINKEVIFKWVRPGDHKDHDCKQPAYIHTHMAAKKRSKSYPAISKRTTDPHFWKCTNFKIVPAKEKGEFYIKPQHCSFQNTNEEFYMDVLIENNKTKMDIVYSKSEKHKEARWKITKQNTRRNTGVIRPERTKYSIEFVGEGKPGKGWFLSTNESPIENSDATPFLLKSGDLSNVTEGFSFSEATSAIGEQRLFVQQEQKFSEWNILSSDPETKWTNLDDDQIGAWMSIHKIHGVCMETQTITVEIKLKLCWLDDAFIFENFDLSEHFINYRRKEDKKDFITRITSGNFLIKNKDKVPSIPIVKFDNLSTKEMDSNLDWLKLTKDNLYVSKGKNGCYPHLQWSRQGILKITDALSAENFPFDYEDFKIALQSDDQFRAVSGKRRYLCLWTPASLEDTLVPRDSYITNIDNCNIPEWHICSFFEKEKVMKIRERDYVQLLCKVNQKRGWEARIESYLVLKRRSAFYLFNYWIMIVLFTLITIVSFALPPKAVLNDRQGTSLAILFLQLGLKFSSTNDLPKLQYLTTLDYLMFSNMLLIVFLLVLQCWVAAIEDPLHRKQHDDICMAVYICVFCVVNLAIVSLAMIRQCIQKKQICDLVIDNYATKEQKEKKDTFTLRVIS